MTSVNEYTVTLKTRQDTWVVIHAEDAATLQVMLDTFDRDLQQKIVSVQGALQAARDALDAIPSGYVAPPGHVDPDAAQNVVTHVFPNAQVIEQTPAPAPQPAPQAPAPAGGLPPEVQIWVAAGSNPQYQDLWVKFPYIPDAALRNEFNQRLKATGVRFFDNTQKAWHGPQNARPAVEQLFREYAHVFGG